MRELLVMKNVGMNFNFIFFWFLHRRWKEVNWNYSFKCIVHAESLTSQLAKHQQIKSKLSHCKVNLGKRKWLVFFASILSSWCYKIQFQLPCVGFPSTKFNDLFEEKNWTIFNCEEKNTLLIVCDYVLSHACTHIIQTY